MIKIQVVGVQFIKTENTKVYYYYTTQKHNIGDLVIIPTSSDGNGADGKVVEINVKKSFPFRLKILD